MISYGTFESDAISLIRKHGFDRFFIYGIKRNFIEEAEVEEYAMLVLEALTDVERFEDCAFLLREIKDYKERYAAGFRLVP